MNRTYELRFKKMACELLSNYNNKPTRVATELNIPVKTYEKWIHLYRRNPYAFDEEEVNFEFENKILRKQLKEKEETIEILKKTFAFFTEKGESSKLLLKS